MAAHDIIGWELSDLGDGIKDVATSVRDKALGAANEIADTVPGGEWVRNAINQGAKWLEDIAKDEFGRWMLVVITDNMFGPLSAVLGPQLASFVWGLPGLAAGEDFSKAWVTSFIARCKKIAEMFGAKFVQDALDKLKPVIDYLEQIIPPELKDLPLEKAKAWLKAAGVTPEAVAEKFGVRPDLVAAQINAIALQPIYNLLDFSEGDGTRATGMATLPLSKLLTERQARIYDPKQVNLARAMTEKRSMFSAAAPRPAAPTTPTTPSKAPAAPPRTRTPMPVMSEDTFRMVNPDYKPEGTSSSSALPIALGLGAVAALWWVLRKKR